MEVRPETERYYSREMSLEVGMERLSILRSMWMRKRHRFAVEVDQRRKTEYDCLMLYVYFEFIIPVLLDFLVVVTREARAPADIPVAAVGAGALCAEAAAAAAVNARSCC